MTRKFVLAASLLVALLVGCGHDAGIGAFVPGHRDPEPDEIGGGVLAPNGQFVSNESLFWRFASLFESAAHALVNVELVGPGVSVTLFSVTEEEVQDGEISKAKAVSSPQPTDPTGHFIVALLDGHVVGECGLMLSAGAGDTLTRGFVYSNDQDITAVSERLRTGRNLGKTSSIIIVAEGVRGGALRVAEQLKKLTKNEYRVVILGYIQRGGNPTAGDRCLATRLGVGAVKAVVAGESGRMAGERNGRPALVPFRTAIKGKRRIDSLYTQMLKYLNL